MGKSTPVLLVTGAPGVGKTTLVKEMGEQLFHAAVPHAVIDIDELARVRPAVPDDRVWAELTVANLRVMWPNYEALGVERLILAGIVQSAAVVDAYRSVIPGADLKVVRLTAPVDTLHDRLRDRVPGSVREFLLGATAGFDREIAALGVEDLTVDNGPDRPLGQVAREILEWLGWLPAAAPIPSGQHPRA
ncbi:MAG TPA: hypothetical protein VIL36_11955 [Acidimicrobiales bacterium]